MRVGTDYSAFLQRCWPQSRLCDCEAPAGVFVPAIAEDRLSSLQDCILHSIMSFLTARQAVRTCVLSRRWVGLWRSAPCLNIDQREFNPTAEAEHLTLRKTPETVRFLNFVDC